MSEWLAYPTHQQIDKVHMIFLSSLVLFFYASTCSTSDVADMDQLEPGFTIGCLPATICWN